MFCPSYLVGLQQSEARATMAGWQASWSVRYSRSVVLIFAGIPLPFLVKVQIQVVVSLIAVFTCLFIREKMHT